MKLVFHKIGKHFPDFFRIYRLYLKAFPPEERAPFRRLINRARSGYADFWSITHDKEWIGFAYTVRYQHLVYLFYLAVDDTKRGQGYGHRIMAALKKHYADNTFFLTRETLDPSTENAAERENRHHFYLSCGMKDLPLQTKEFGVIYDVMSTGEMIDPDEYQAMMLAYGGPFVVRHMEMRTSFEEPK